MHCYFSRPLLRTHFISLQHGWTQKHREPFTYHQLVLQIAHLTARIPTSLFNRVLEIFVKQNTESGKICSHNGVKHQHQLPALHWPTTGGPCTAVLLCSLFNSLIDLYMTDGNKLMIGTHFVSVIVSGSVPASDLRVLKLYNQL